MTQVLLDAGTHEALIVVGVAGRKRPFTGKVTTVDEDGLVTFQRWRTPHEAEVLTLALSINWRKPWRWPWQPKPKVKPAPPVFESCPQGDPVTIPVEHVTYAHPYETRLHT